MVLYIDCGDMASTDRASIIPTPMNLLQVFSL